MKYCVMAYYCISMLFISQICFGSQNKTDVKNVLFKVADYYLAHPQHESTDWTNAAFYAGLYSLYDATKEEKYLIALKKIALKNNYQLGPRLDHADDQAIGQTYLDVYRVTGDINFLNSTKNTFDVLLLNQKPGRVLWWWCDSLFMGPPVMAKLSRITKNSIYLNVMDQMFWDTKEFLYSVQDNLFFRDESFFNKTETNGKRVFWSRGNGWVLAGLVRILQEMPTDYPTRQKYLDLYVNMSSKIKSLQNQDGFWKASLLHPESTPNGESSGTGFYVYALAYGVRNQLLDTSYLDSILLGWNALYGAVRDDGMLGWVQPIGYKPEQVKADDTDVFGAGAFLLAGSELLNLLQQ